MDCPATSTHAVEDLYVTQIGGHSSSTWNLNLHSGFSWISEVEIFLFYYILHVINVPITIATMYLCANGVGYMDAWMIFNMSTYKLLSSR